MEDILNRLVDEIFDCALDWSWSDWASASGLCPETVRRLGERETKRPQFRTVLLLAQAVGYNKVELV